MIPGYTIFRTIEAHLESGQTRDKLLPGSRDLLHPAPVARHDEQPEGNHDAGSADRPRLGIPECQHDTLQDHELGQQPEPRIPPLPHDAVADPGGNDRQTRMSGLGDAREKHLQEQDR
ncbi:hypothetical protein CGZ94_01510 [Enemella evansiae]|uniref:Uncharacterized protein n=1 Tax=Enemella evansiae TaxID=2016499 RepID=A0A255GP50_9ACTN|nr:hypothetical protein CGZ94_01510 [Enemella evansiae]